MNREIKFRGKRVNGGEWVYGMTISNGTIKRKLNNVFFEVAENKWVGVYPETLGQYTGLTDKNGVKIFEGDIISIGDPNIKYLTMWRNAGFAAKQIGASSYIGLTYWASDIEVLGNVIDNPELMK